MALFQFDFRNGVAVLNRMLNHAARARARALAGLDHHYSAPIDDSALDAYRTQLDINGTRRVYVGDGHVWTWYRGTGVGPYPCMSALQALERVCDQLIGIGIPLANIVASLLDGCENLAIVGLVVGLLVRHLENADRLLDPCLAEPMIWHLEFGRVVNEGSGLAASSEGIVQAERRQWSLREAAMWLVLCADETRADELRTIGQQLVATTRRLIAEALGDDGDEATIEEQLVTVRAWASGLDRATYEAHQAEDGVYVQSRPPDDVVVAMQRDNEELQRAHEATRLMVRYHIQPRQRTAQPITAEDLIIDLAVAQELLENPPALSPSGKWDAPVAVAAAALEAHIVSEVELPIEALCFAAEAVIRVGKGEVAPHQFESEESYFEQGADRSAASVLPLLLLPNAAALRALMDAGDGSETYSSATATASSIAQSLANEVRVHLARGLDKVWEAPCTGDDKCHHGTALQLAVETMRDCVFGTWDPNTGRRRVTLLARPCRASARRHAGQSDPLFSPRRSDSSARTGRSGQHLCLRARAGASHGAPRRTPPLPACIRR